MHASSIAIVGCQMSRDNLLHNGTIHNMLSVDGTFCPTVNTSLMFDKKDHFGKDMAHLPLGNNL
jgi:hypothetical protein